VVALGLNDVEGFVKSESNKGIFGAQKYIEKVSDHRYIFDRSAFNQEGIILDISQLGTGKYNFVLTCTDFFTGEVEEKIAKLIIQPYIRWRETTPILNK
jgi:hypothetical protein